MTTYDELDLLLVHIIDTIHRLEAHDGPTAAAHSDDMRKLAQVVFRLVLWVRDIRP